MQYLQETTEWSASWVPNHTYYVSDDRRKMVGYIKAGTKSLLKLSKPMSFDTRGRKFTVVKRGEADSVYFGAPPQPKPAANVVSVAGSGGKTYFVTVQPGRMSCTCPGFQFRNKCKHVDSMKV